MDNFSQLVHLAQSGDIDAFAMLVARFQNMAYGYAYAMLGDLDLAQDAVQEAFVDAYHILPTLREPYAFPVWLKRIVFKHCDRIKRRKRHQMISLDNVEEAATPQPGPPELLERHEMRKQVGEALQAIPANLRTVVILFYGSGYSHQEIADFLGVPLTTVKSRLHNSRLRLKERMLDMVQDEFEQNPLPEQFTRDAVNQSIKRASEMNKDHQYDKAEKLLRSLLSQIPDDPEALKELNRAMMHGRVYGQGRWDLLSALAAQGKTILRKIDDEEIHRQVAQTLLAIPAMQEAISFLENWIAEKGTTLERLGMLAWARGCTGDFLSSETMWREIISIAQSQPEAQVLKYVPFIAYTLVNCFTAADRLARAQSVAREAWAICSDLGSLQGQEDLKDDSGWLSLWHMAKLDVNDIAPILLSRHPESADLAEQAVRLAIRGWVESQDVVVAGWLDWARTCIDSGNYPLLEKYRLVMLRELRKRDFWKEANQLAGRIWEMLGDVQKPDAGQALETWDWERYNPVGAIESRNWQAAEELVRAEISARGVQGAVGWAAIVTGGSGSPTPQEIVRALDENGVEKVDEYGMFGWYIIAREAAHAGESTKAFDALRKALSYWSNTPYWITDLWENDTYWGVLRDNPEFRQAFEQRRQRIGTIYGELHYFPGW